jgi:hypothetical protein
MFRPRGVQTQGTSDCFVEPGEVAEMFMSCHSVHNNFSVVVFRSTFKFNDFLSSHFVSKVDIFNAIQGLQRTKFVGSDEAPGFVIKKLSSDFSISSETHF